MPVSFHRDQVRIVPAPVNLNSSHEIPIFHLIVELIACFHNQNISIIQTNLYLINIISMESEPQTRKFGLKIFSRLAFFAPPGGQSQNFERSAFSGRFTHLVARTGAAGLECGPWRAAAAETLGGSYHAPVADFWSAAPARDGGYSASRFSMPISSRSSP